MARHRSIKAEEPSSSKAKTSSVSPPEKKKRRQRTKHDPNAPKRPMTGYQYFYSHFLAKLRQNQVDGRPLLDAARQAGAAWKELNENDKQVYLEKSESSHAEYVQQMKQYKTTDSYKQFQQSLKNAAKQKAKSRSRNPGDISVFSEEFIKYNQERSSELRDIRLKVNQLDDEQTSLQKRLQQLQSAVQDAADKHTQYDRLIKVLRSHSQHIRADVFKCAEKQTSLAAQLKRQAPGTLAAVLKIISQNQQHKNCLVSLKVSPLKLPS